MKQKFDKKSYEDLLKFILKSKLKISSFKDVNESGRSIIIRHDVDFCPVLALDLALIDIKYNIKSTFFFLLRSSFYNTISSQNYNAIKKIISLGHTVGLHFDASIYGNKELDVNCRKEISILEKIFDIKIDIVSFHRPVKSLINTNKEIANCKHTYMKKYFEDMVYCSDSEGRWRFKNPIDIISKEINKIDFKMQLLIHPIWWTTSGRLSSTSKLDYFLNKRKNYFMQQLEENSKPYMNRKKAKIINK